jgi:hypothetical protein
LISSSHPYIIHYRLLSPVYQRKNIKINISTAFADIRYAQPISDCSFYNQKRPEQENAARRKRDGSSSTLCPSQIQEVHFIQRGFEEDFIAKKSSSIDGDSSFSVVLDFDFFVSPHPQSSSSSSLSLHTHRRLPFLFLIIHSSTVLSLLEIVQIQVEISGLR